MLSLLCCTFVEVLELQRNSVTGALISELGLLTNLSKFLLR